MYHIYLKRSGENWTPYSPSPNQTFTDYLLEMGRRRAAETVIDYEPGILEVIITHRRTKRGIVTREKVVPIPRLGASSSKRTKVELPHDVVRAKASSSSSLSPLKVLRTYAKLPGPSITALPPTVYFSHTKQTLTIFDAYPKALFHFLVLPRLSDGDERSSPSDLTDLRTLLRKRAFAEETLRVLADEAARLRGVIEGEMRARYGFAWEVWAGFHACAVDGSDRHLHLHVISSDLTAQALKTKKHYNSFSPRAGFFVPLAEVRAWFNDNAAAPQCAALRRRTMSPVSNAFSNAFVVANLAKNMPALKKHLQEEFDALRKREGKSKKRRRETEDVSVSDRETSSSIAKGKGRKVARLS
ncbi:hypothetical protein EDB85DRAFT_1944573 [Lactarius pseudohatsudake]|nr:hypothetical protein EDB85DRAFT_1944573 [Lactarius pseudohatsudake]